MKLPHRTALGMAVSALLLGSPLTAIAQRGDRPGHVMKPPPADWKIPPAPVLPPDQALKTFAVPEGFHVELVASEPDIHDPVAIAFDARGRMWVAQMIGFMPDVDGKGQGEAVGKISILEDSDGDGKVDQAKVFLDKIVLPRALALCDADQGLLYADDAQLHHIEIQEGDLPGKQVVIDPEYAKGGNVEHKANGLLCGLDNWYYSAGSDKKYRRIEGQWVTATTEKRGQWGISQDDEGRLATNTNSNFISMELYPPGLTVRNPNHKFTSPASVRLKDQSTWPSRITPGINRGYLDGFLTKEGYLNGPTATCGPAIYRGDNFPARFYGNLFLPEPAGNFVKRALIAENEGALSIRQAYEGREFFTSTDERSRIVNAYTAPDGTLYFVDFYRGILQDGAYMTTYLRGEVLRRKLDKGIGLGRIYRIANDHKKPGPQPRLGDMTGKQLAAQLGHANGWWRDTAQRLLVQRRDQNVVPSLQALLDPQHTPNPVSSIHALWTLRGLDALTPADVGQAFQSTNPAVVASAIRAAEIFADSGQSAGVLKQFAALAGRKDPQIQAQLCASTGLFRNTAEDRDSAFGLLIKILKNSPRDNAPLRDLCLSGLHQAEPEFLDALIADGLNHPVTQDLIGAIIQSRNQKNIAQLSKTVTAESLPPDTRQRLIAQLASAAITRKQPALIGALLNQAASFSPPERQAVATGLLKGKKAIKGRYQPLNMGTQKPELLTKADLLPSDQQQKLLGLFNYSGGKKTIYLKTEADRKQYTLGKTHYERICLACHQGSGEGSPFLAPPLVDSEWVLESPKRLIALVMDGMTGPVTVNGITYTADTAPQVQPLMPGLRTNPELNDEQMAAILTYIRNSWGNGATPVSQQAVSDYRKQHEARLPFTEAGLKKIK